MLWKTWSGEQKKRKDASKAGGATIRGTVCKGKAVSEENSIWNCSERCSSESRLNKGAKVRGEREVLR